MMVILALFFFFCTIGYVAFMLRSWWYFSQIQCREYNSQPLSVSVIIPARNEAKGIRACLESILAQDYPKALLEVIVINDHSTDDTAAIVQNMALQYPNLRIEDLQVDDINSYKKAALTQGISKAQGEIILQTDADCQATPHWVQSMVHHFDLDTALVSGPILLTHGDHWLEKFQTLESMGLVAIGGGSLAAGHPNMANGANFAYRKSVFEAINGFEGVDHVASGDDELLLQKVHARPEYQLRFAKCKDAIVRTPCMSSWKAFKAQRLRWVSKSRHYPNRWVNVSQGIAYLAHWSIVVLGVLALMDSTYLWGFVAVTLLKIGVDFLLLRQAAVFFHKLPLLTWVLALQPLHILYVIWIGIAGGLTKTYTWKDRSVN